MPSMYVDDAQYNEEAVKFNEALENLTIPSTPTNLRSLWKPQIRLFQNVHPDAAKIFTSVSIPGKLTDMKRIRDFVHSTSITPTGVAYTPQCSEILPGKLWVADHFTGTNPSTLQCLGVTHVICVGNDRYHQGCPQSPSVIHESVVVPRDLYQIPLVGIIDDTVTYVQSVVRADPNHRILVHCAMGTNWSPGIAVACLMDITGCSFEVAYATVHARREAVRLHKMVAEAIQQWWTLEQLRPELPKGRGYRAFKWAVEDDTDSGQ